MEVPRSEHPRPDFWRADWLNLNGQWQFEIDTEKTGLEHEWYGGKEFAQRIIVPFPPESVLSGIGVKDFMESVWYRRFFDVPDRWLSGRILLHFGAVDYEARVYVNSSQVGYHRGGYTPFTCEVTDVAKAGENELVVWARDDCRSGLQATGKQSHRLESYRCLYTRVTGIWQTVWVESVPRVYIHSFRLKTDPYNGKVYICASVMEQGEEYDLSVTAHEGSERVAEAKGSFHGPTADLMLTVPRSRMWSPDDPYLYGLRLQLTGKEGSVDVVKSHFGFRDIRIVGNRILLNNRARFLRLVLDQGYYPEGIYTAPTDEALKRDVEISKEMGFDGARLHQKVFEPRYLYWADRLGYLVAGEFPDWGSDLSNSSARDALLDEWIEAVQRDFNHSCIIMWTPLNERRFKEEDKDCANFLRRLVRITKTIDPTRPVIDSSGYTHVETDVYDVHDYEQNVEIFKPRYMHLEEVAEEAPRRPVSIDWRKTRPGLQETAPYRGQPFMVSEYGGAWWHPEAGEEESWGYGEKPKSLDDLIARYQVLTECLLFNPAISAFCYTQLYDIEQETNGLHTYDRRPKVKPEIICSINKQVAAIERS